MDRFHPSPSPSRMGLPSVSPIGVTQKCYGSQNNAQGGSTTGCVCHALLTMSAINSSTLSFASRGLVHRGGHALVTRLTYFSTLTFV